MLVLHVLQLAAQAITPPDVTNLPRVNADQGTIKTILTLVFTVTGAIAVLMVIIGGIKYSSSGGDPGEVSKAKGTIIFAIVGLILSILSVSIVNFVLTRVI